MKRKNKHLDNKEEVLYSSIDPNIGARITENTIHRHQKRKKRRSSKQMIRELMQEIDTEKLLI